MILAGIDDGDVVLVDRSKVPRAGDIVVAVLDGDFTIKRLIRERGTWALHAESSEWPDIVVDELSELVIWGVVTVSFRFHRPRKRSVTSTAAPPMSASSACSIPPSRECPPSSCRTTTA